MFDDGDSVGLRHLDGVRGGNWNLNWNVDGNGYGAVYCERNMLGDFDWVRFGYLDGIRTVDRHGVWYLKKERSNLIIDETSL